MPEQSRAPSPPGVRETERATPRRPRYPGRALTIPLIRYNSMMQNLNQIHPMVLLSPALVQKALDTSSRWKQPQRQRTGPGGGLGPCPDTGVGQHQTELQKCLPSSVQPFPKPSRRRFFCTAVEGLRLSPHNKNLLEAMEMVCADGSVERCSGWI